jgi:hypothetical protein
VCSSLPNSTNNPSREGRTDGSRDGKQPGTLGFADAASSASKSSSPCGLCSRPQRRIHSALKLCIMLPRRCSLERGFAQLQLSGLKCLGNLPKTRPDKKTSGPRVRYFLLTSPLIELRRHFVTVTATRETGDLVFAHQCRSWYRQNANGKLEFSVERNKATAHYCSRAGRRSLLTFPTLDNGNRSTAFYGPIARLRRPRLSCLQRISARASALESSY